MARRAGGWTKWWWVRYFEVQTWSVEERRARIVMGMAGLIVALVGLWLIGAILGWLGVGDQVAAALAACVSVVLGAIGARPIATELYPDLIRTADSNAAERLSRTTD